MKKIMLISMAIILLFYPVNKCILVLAETSDDLSQTVNNEVESIDTSDLENSLNTYFAKDLYILNFDIKKTVTDIINGEFNINYKNTFDFVTKIISSQIKNILPIFITIIAFSIIISLSKELNFSKNNDIKSIINIASTSIVFIICIVQMSELIDLSKNTLNGISSVMRSLFPILLTIMTALGSSKSVSFFSPVIAFLSNTIVNIITNFMFPIVILCLVLVLCSNLSKTLKLGKMYKFFNDFYKWIIGAIFTIFVAFISLQGISVSTFDSIGIRTAKFTIKSLIPYAGGFITDSFNVITASGILIKNAFGIVGVFILFASAIFTIISLLCFRFGLKITSGLIEPICDNKLPDFLSDLSEIITMLVTVIIICSVMYILIIGVIMATANNLG